MSGKRRILIIMGGAAAVAATIGAGGCSTVKSVFTPDADAGAVQAPIRNPFGAYYNGAGGGSDHMVLRTKKGDRAIEVELPADSTGKSDLIVPLSSAFKDTGRDPASNDGQAGIDETYKDRKPSMADREILATLPQATYDDKGRRGEVEEALGVVPADDPTPQADKSYLAGVDRIKQLYRLGRYEAALLETDEMIRLYQTDAHLYEMRGTLLDRLGKRDLAIKSWSQSLRFNPANASLRKFLDRKRKIASEAATYAEDGKTKAKTAEEERAPASEEKGAAQ